MTKKLPLICVILVLTFMLQACSGTNLVAISGAYWNENPTGTAILAIDETLEYNVELTDSLASSSIKSTNDHLSLEIEPASSYVVQLQSSEDLSHYILTSTLTVSGKYSYGLDKTLSFSEDTIKSVVKFNGLDHKNPLSVIESVKTVDTLTCLVAEPKTEDDFFQMQATTKSVSKDGNIQSTIEISEELKEYFEHTDLDVNYENVFKNTFVDNELILMYFRAFEITSSFNYSFQTIDVFANRSVSLSAQAIYNESGTMPISIKNYMYNDILQNEIVFKTNGLSIKVPGDFGGLVYEVYYADSPMDKSTNKEDNTNRHRPIAIYSPTIYNTGYLLMEISSVVTK